MANIYTATMEERAEKIQSITLPDYLVNLGLTKEQLLSTFVDKESGEKRYRYAGIIRAITDGTRAKKAIGVDNLGQYNNIVLRGVVNYETGELQGLYGTKLFDRREVLAGSKEALPKVEDFWKDSESVKNFQEKGQFYLDGTNIASDKSLTEVCMKLLAQRFVNSDKSKEKNVRYPVFIPAAVKVGLDPVVDKESGEVKSYKPVPFVKGMEDYGFLTLGADNQAHIVKKSTLEKRLIGIKDGEKSLRRSSKLFKGIELDLATAERLLKYGVAPVVACKSEEGTHYPAILSFDDNGGICEVDFKNPIYKQLKSEGWEMVKKQYPKEDTAVSQAKVEAADEARIVEPVEDKPVKKTAKKTTKAEKPAVEKKTPAGMKMR